MFALHTDGGIVRLAWNGLGKSAEIYATIPDRPQRRSRLNNHQFFDQVSSLLAWNKLKGWQCCTVLSIPLVTPWPERRFSTRFLVKTKQRNRHLDIPLNALLNVRIIRPTERGDQDSREADKKRESESVRVSVGSQESRHYGGKWGWLRNNLDEWTWNRKIFPLKSCVLQINISSGNWCYVYKSW